MGTPTPPPVDASAPVLDKIIQVAERKLTGAVEITTRVGRAPRQVNVYLDNGLIYAVTSPQYQPPARQWSERALGEALPEGITEEPEEAAWRIASAREANGGPGLPAEQIDRARKDWGYGLLAATLTWNRPGIKVRKRATTSTRKFDPSSWQRVVADLSTRQNAYQRSWSALCQALVDHDIPPADAAKAAERLGVRLDGSVIFANPNVSLDQVAYDTGLSRAGIVDELTRQLSMGYPPHFGRVEPIGQILTPEALEDPERAFALAPQDLTPRSRPTPVAPVMVAPVGPAVQPVATSAADLLGHGITLASQLSSDPQDDDDDLGDQYHPGAGVPAPVPAAPVPTMSVAEIAEVAARAAGRHAHPPIAEQGAGEFFTFAPALSEPQVSADTSAEPATFTGAQPTQAASEPAEDGLPSFAAFQSASTDETPAAQQYPAYTPPTPLPVSDDLPPLDAQFGPAFTETYPDAAQPQATRPHVTPDEQQPLPAFVSPTFEEAVFGASRPSQPAGTPSEPTAPWADLSTLAAEPADSAAPNGPWALPAPTIAPPAEPEWTQVGPTSAPTLPQTDVTPALPAPTPEPAFAPPAEPVYESAPAPAPPDPRLAVDHRSGAVLSRWADSVSSFLDAETQVFILDRLRSAAIEEVSSLEQVVDNSVQAQTAAAARVAEIQEALAVNQETLARIQSDLDEARRSHSDAVAAHEAKRRYALEIRDALVAAQQEVAQEEAALDELLAQVARAQVRTEAARAAVRATGEQIQVVDQEIESVTGPAVQAAALNADAFERDNYLPALRTVQAVNAQLDEAQQRLAVAEREHAEAAARASRARRLVDTLASTI